MPACFRPSKRRQYFGSISCKGVTRQGIQSVTRIFSSKWTGSIEDLLIAHLLSSTSKDKAQEQLKLILDSKLTVDPLNLVNGWGPHGNRWVFDKNQMILGIGKNYRDHSDVRLFGSSVQDASAGFAAGIESNRQHLEWKAKHNTEPNTAWLARLLENDRNVGDAAKAANPDRWFWPLLAEAEWGAYLFRD